MNLDAGTDKNEGAVTADEETEQQSQRFGKTTLYKKELDLARRKNEVMKREMEIMRRENEFLRLTQPTPAEATVRRLEAITPKIKFKRGAI